MANSVNVTVRDVLISLEKLPGPPLPPADQNLFDSCLNQLTNILMVRQKLDEEISVSHRGTGGETAVDPKDPMEKIAQALSNAESVLNTQNLVITNALVEMNMKIDAGSGAATETTIQFGIEPQSSH